MNIDQTNQMNLILNKFIENVMFEWMDEWMNEMYDETLIHNYQKVNSFCFLSVKHQNNKINWLNENDCPWKQHESW